MTFKKYIYKNWFCLNRVYIITFFKYTIFIKKKKQKKKCLVCHTPSFDLQCNFKIVALFKISFFFLIKEDLSLKKKN